MGVSTLLRQHSPPRLVYALKPGWTLEFCIQDLIEFLQSQSRPRNFRKGGHQGTNRVCCVCDLDRVVDIGDDSPTVRANKVRVGAEVGKQLVNAGCLDDRAIGSAPATDLDDVTAHSIGIGWAQGVTVRLAVGARDRDVHTRPRRYGVDDGL